MRAPAILLNVLIACTIGGVIGYTMASRAKGEEIMRLRQERDNILIRERELHAQLEDALAARAALAQETQRLQQDLSERLRRLEEAAAKLAPAAQSDVKDQGSAIGEEK